MIKNILLGLALVLLAGASYFIYALSTAFVALGYMVFGPPTNPEEKKDSNKK